MSCLQILISWLNNAYAMERSLAKTLRENAGDAEQFPEVKSKLLSHAEETDRQAEQVKSEIERLGGEASETKAKMAEIFATMGGYSTDLADDKVVKNAIAEHSAEHFEMATYLSIIKAAEICGEEQTAEMAKQIMKEETTTGEELKTKLEFIVEQYINRKTSEQ